MTLQQYQQFRERAEQKQQELTQAEAASQDGDTEEVNKRNRLEELSKEAEEQARTKLQLEKELKAVMEPKKALERNLQYTNQQKASAEQSLKAANERLEQKRREIIARAGSSESEAARRAQRLKAAEEKLVAAKEKYDLTRQAVTEYRRKYDELEPHVDIARKNVQDIERKLFAIRSKISNLESSSNNSLAMFGQRCGAVKREIDRYVQQGKFRGQVSGPIGAYLKIVPGKEKFASLAEVAIGNGALDRFVVTNDHDRKVLQSIRNKLGCSSDCGIFQVAPHPRYNVPGPPAEGIETVVSVLNVSDDLVFNCLIDTCRIEERALAQSKEESEEKLLQEVNGKYSIRGKIKNVFFLPNGDNWSVTKGNLNMVANEKRFRQTIGVDKTAALADAKRDVEMVQKELAIAKEEESKLGAEHHRNQKAWNVNKKEYQSLHEVINRIAEEIDAIRAEEDSATNFDTDTSELEQDVSEAKDSLDQIKTHVAQLRQDISEKDPEIQAVRNRLEEVSARNEKVIKDMDNAANDLTAYMASLSQREEKLEKKRKKVQQYMEIIKKQEERAAEIQTDVSKYLKHSRRLAYARLQREQRERLEAESDSEMYDSQFTQEPTDEELEAIETCNVDRDSNYYRARVERLNKKVADEMERRNASREDALAAYEKWMRAKEQLDGKMVQVQEVKTVKRNLTEDVRERKVRWKQFRKHIAEKTSMAFDEILNQKGSSGTVEFDFDNERLDLIVQKDSADCNSQQKDVKALSGGERSYTTIALLLALGESLETPFRILDEFDVFLDTVSRKLAIESLIQMGKSMSHRQFVFITPQDVSNVEANPMLKILKLNPPARNDVFGGPSQQTLEFSQS